MPTLCETDFCLRLWEQGWKIISANDAFLIHHLGATQVNSLLGLRITTTTHSAWRRYFNADPSIVGKEIVLAGAPLTVIGVTRPGATLPGDETIAFWAPLTLATTFDRSDPATSQERSLFVVGRRRAAVTADQVRAWFATWVRQRFVGTELEPVRTRTVPLLSNVTCGSSSFA